MNKARLVWVWMAAALLLGACQSSKVAVDYDTDADFNNYQRYAWLEEGSGSDEQIDPLLADRVREAVATQLQNGRFTAADGPADADFLVRYYASSTAQTEASRTRGSVGLGGGSGGMGMGVSLGIPLGGDRVKREIHLVVDILDAQSKELQWRATNSLQRGDDSPEEITDRINAAVAEMFAQFPPQE